MPSNARVVVVEDDFYSRHWMEMLLRRDWRTRVIKQVDSPATLFAALADLVKKEQKFELILVDTDIPYDTQWLPGVLKKLADYNDHQREKHYASKKKYHPPVVLFTGVHPLQSVANLANFPGFGGYILKDEICYSLAWAVTLAVSGRTVVTPGVLKLFSSTNPLPLETISLNGRKPHPFIDLSETEVKAARLAFLFSMERSDLANELMISDDYSYGLISSLYERTGLNDILEGILPPETYFGDHPAIKKLLEEALKPLRKSNENVTEFHKGKLKKVKNRETLAFHLLTFPEIEIV